MTNAERDGDHRLLIKMRLERDEFRRRILANERNAANERVQECDRAESER